MDRNINNQRVRKISNIKTDFDSLWKVDRQTDKHILNKNDNIPSSESAQKVGGT